MKAEAKDNRIPVSWSRAVSTRHLFDLYGRAYYALESAGKKYMINEMKSQIANSRSGRETLSIIQQYVRFE